MAQLQRKAGAIWEGTLKEGSGLISTESKALFKYPYNFSTRFEQSEEGTNPEELIAAAHAGCYSMALANTLKQEGYQPINIVTSATCTLIPLNGGFEITAMDLHVHAEVEGIEQSALEEIAAKADQGCPVSNLLREGLDLTRSVELE